MTHFVMPLYLWKEHRGYACMAYHKPDQLMQLFTLVLSKHRNVTLDDVREEFGVSHRTAQPIMGLAYLLLMSLCDCFYGATSRQSRLPR